jgi:hypothetical protein
MENTKYTPAPWVQSHREIPNDEDGMYSTQVYTKDGKTICTLAWYPMPPKKVIIDGKPMIQTGTYRDANAKLISAAPDLLEALKGLVEWSAHFPTIMNSDLNKALTAINKATK